MADGNRFPTRSHAQATSEVGVSIIAALVREGLGWEFRRTPQESDFGIDGYIDIVASNGYVTGKSLAVQIKTGHSYFAESTEKGWLFRGQLKHVNYYLNMEMPVLILLVDPTSHKVWWRHFEAYETDRTTDGYSLIVPHGNLLTASAKDHLQRLAGDAVDYLPHLEEFWMLPDRIKDHLICVQVQRREIEKCLTRPFQRIFERLSVTHGVIVSAMNKVDFLIDGYNSDTRELFEIPEVQQWVKAVIQEVKYLCYFLNLDGSAQGMSTIIKCVGGAEVVKNLDAAKLLSLRSPHHILDFMDEQYHWLNQFVQLHALGEKVNRIVSSNFARYCNELTNLRTETS